MYEVKNVSRETMIALKRYQSLILKWNKTINLVSYKSAGELWSRHILDSLQLMQYIDELNIHLVDVGSGGGFPGVVLSIAGVQNVTLVESDTRKSIFLAQAAKICDNKINIINQRIETLDLNCDILTSRACSPLKKFFSYTQNIKVKAKYLLLKGQEYQKEIDEAQKKWSFYYLTYDSISSKNSKILEINNVKNIA
ncbi:16S rRNA (guanine(527)-N(7))-methyltransferase RsmG [Candidatus Tisiphia endosymbiont of Nemotelus uliginosus]|uniref:16S rRNA (guanine(527)-N(7))-methyltransferase RsmG n=1 Tax=Candidatus Tisiphia endosymbiont of Nemotelus uliginosus TaxID=3077926 RepID=UPI0035C91634